MAARLRATAGSATLPQIQERNVDCGADSFISALVARLVGFREMRENEKARGSVLKEYCELRDRGVWDEKLVRKYNDVCEEAVRNSCEVHFGRIFATCSEKDFEMNNERMRKYKGRICFDGRPDRVRNQMGVRAAFQHLNSIPASMPAGKCGIANGLLPNNFVSCADAEKAYCQSPFKGIPTWVELPFDMWPAEWHK